MLSASTVGGLHHLARGQKVHLQLAVHRTILVVDVEGFGDQRRTNSHQLTVRAGLYRILEQAFSIASIRWAACHREDRGDGVFVLVPAEVPKSVFVETLPHAVVRELREYNAAHSAEARIRLRMALHGGEVHYDEHGATGTSVNLAFRLLDAHPLKVALTGSPGVLALITSSSFFDEVIRHSPASGPTSYRPTRVVAKETTTVGWICLPDYPYPPRDVPPPPAERPSPVPRQLPTRTPHFVGRAGELRQLTAQLDTAGGTMVICAINGTAGIGKTTLAVHWAHQVANQFPDGQLYVDLRGFHPSSTSMQSTEAIRGFLDAFNVPPERIPAGVDAQAALYRSVLAGRHVLIVLDNARDAEQIRPLLPGSPTCLVVITSRDQLVDLITREGARPVNLAVLDSDEAQTLLARRIGQARVGAEPDAIHELISYCAGLPLALAIVAARIELNPKLSIRAFADELANERTRLDVLDYLRAVFSWSYRHLDPPVARMFRLLGLHPGLEFSLAAAASMAGVPVDQARMMLTELTRAQLLVEPIPGRFAFQDLLRAYANEQALALDADNDRHAVAHRLLDCYLHTSFAASEYVVPHQEIPAPPEEPPQPGVTLCDIDGYRRAAWWFAEERPTLLASIRYAYSTGFDDYAWKLALTLVAFLDGRGRLHDLITIEQDVMASARRLGDDFALARTRLMMGWVYARLGDCVKAQVQAEQSMELSKRLGDRWGEVGCHFVLAIVYGWKEQQVEAVSHAQCALDFFQAVDNQPWCARTHRLYGWIYGRCKDFLQAIEHDQQALLLLRSFDDHANEAHILDNLARAYHCLGNYSQATAHYNRAIELNQGLGDHYNEAVVLCHLGDTYHVMGDHLAAQTTWQRALEILESLNIPDVDQVRAKLDKRVRQNGA